MTSEPVVSSTSMTSTMFRAACALPPSDSLTLLMPTSGQKAVGWFWVTWSWMFS